MTDINYRVCEYKLDVFPQICSNCVHMAVHGTIKYGCICSICWERSVVTLCSEP